MLATIFVVLIGFLLPVRGAAPVEIPFTYTNGFIWVAVQVSDKGPKLNLLLDSGAAVSALSASAAERLNVHEGALVPVKGVGGKTHGLWPQPLWATANGVKLPRNYLVVDLCDLEDSCKCRVDGLIGADFFEGKRVQIDFRESRIRLLDRAVASATATRVALKQRRGVWRVPVQVNDGSKQWMRLDTGCASDMHWVASVSEQRADATKVSVALTEFITATATTDVAIGGKRFAHVPTVLHRNEIFADECGLIGNGLLSRFQRVTIDTKVSFLVLE